MAAGSALLAGAVAAPVIGGLVGADQVGRDRDAANAARAQALAQYAGISIPEAQDMMLNLQQYQSQGQLDPALEQIMNLGPSAMEQISGDPRLRQEQMNALNSIAGLASGNPTMADTAGFELARQNSAAEMQAKNNQVLQEMQQRGQAGSGAELLAKLQNNQAGAQMMQKAQLEQAQAMQQARLQALQQQANMAGNIRTQDYGEASNLAKAKDAISQFNAANAQSVGSRNTGAKNTAQQANLANQQQIANLNTQTMNNQQIQNKGQAQQTFNNEMALAGGKAGQLNNQAAAAQQQAGATAGMWAGIGQGVGTGLAGYLNGQKKTGAEE